MESTEPQLFVKHASIMGFPITFQFKGSEGIKWRLVGNAVCPWD